MTEAFVQEFEARTGTATADRILSLRRLDPFLMLDEFSSENPGDYIGGFPSHPHRGFETVTYVLAGENEHRDSFGNADVLRPDGGTARNIGASGGMLAVQSASANGLSPAAHRFMSESP